MSTAVVDMPKKRDETQGSGGRRGRPKGAGRITLRYAVVTTPEYRTWMEQFMAHTGETEVSDVFRDGVRLLAEKKGFREPPKR